MVPDAGRNGIFPCLQLAGMQDTKPPNKVVVLTHFKSSRLWLKEQLTAKGFSCWSLANKEAPKRRTQVRSALISCHDALHITYH